MVCQCETFCGTSLTGSPLEGSPCLVVSMGLSVQVVFVGSFSLGPAVGSVRKGPMEYLITGSPLGSLNPGSSWWNFVLWGPLFPFTVILYPADSL